MKQISKIILVMLFLLSSGFVKSQSTDQAFIFGEVYTTSGEKYQGFIRWGKEEVYWTDRLNATKRINPYIKYLSREDREFIEKGEKNWLSDLISDALDTEGSFVHSFACRFGDVKTIKAAGGKSIDVHMRNGVMMHFKSGSNDLGATLRVYDKDQQEKVISWDEVDQVIFSNAPQDWRSPFGGTLWGEVETNFGKFTGQVQWDHDERTGAEKLDGDSEGKDLSIPFSDILAIAREGRGSFVVLQDGNEVFLTGSNDVNEDIRGIIVSIPGMGRLDIPWEDFRKVTFMPDIERMPAYDDFEKASKLMGTLKSVDGKSITGEIVYDLDEAYSYEMLNGRQEMSEWEIPFNFIAQIKPKNYKFSTVKLKSGKELIIGRMQDVSEGNDGVLVFTAPDQAEYFSWDKIEAIIFQ